jgi:predicted GNAT superfamily acetyltransferase
MSSEDEEDNNELVESEPVEAELPPTEKELAEARSLESRRKMREQMQADIEAFLNKGGRIEQLEPSASSQGITAGVNDLSQ